MCLGEDHSLSRIVQQKEIPSGGNVFTAKRDTLIISVFVTRNLGSPGVKNSVCNEKKKAEGSETAKKNSGK